MSLTNDINGYQLKEVDGKKIIGARKDLLEIFFCISHCFLYLLSCFHICNFLLCLSLFLAALAALYLTLVTGWLGDWVSATLEFWHKEWLLRLQTKKTTTTKTTKTTKTTTTKTTTTKTTTTKRSTENKDNNNEDNDNEDNDNKEDNEDNDIKDIEDNDNEDNDNEDNYNKDNDNEDNHKKDNKTSQECETALTSQY